MTDNPEIGFWPSVMGFILEGFALYAASMHSVRFCPVEPHPDEEIRPSSEISARAARFFVTGFGDSEPGRDIRGRTRN